MHKHKQRLPGRYTYILSQLAKITSETFAIPQQSMLLHSLIDYVKPDDGEGKCNSEMDPDERERETVNDIISTVKKDST